MKTFHLVRAKSILGIGASTIAVALFAVQPASAAPVDFGTTTNFAVLSATTITNTGTTTISGTAGGDLGISPGSAFSDLGALTTTGVQHLADAVAVTAQTDLVAAYNDAAGRTPTTEIPTELGGSTLIPGTYVTASGELQITGTLTLDAAGDPDALFIFIAGSTLVTASSSDMVLINGANPCNVIWVVGSSATLGTNSLLMGRVLAMASITATTGAEIEGQLLARTGAVTLDTNVITNNECPAGVTPTPTPTPTDTGEELPGTSSGSINILLGGAVITLIAIASFAVRRFLR